MKQYTFKDGVKVIAATVDEAKQKHKVMAAAKYLYYVQFKTTKESLKYLINIRKNKGWAVDERAYFYTKEAAEKFLKSIEKKNPKLVNNGKITQELSYQGLTAQDIRSALGKNFVLDDNDGELYFKFPANFNISMQLRDTFDFEQALDIEFCGNRMRIGYFEYYDECEAYGEFFTGHLTITWKTDAEKEKVLKKLKEKVDKIVKDISSNLSNYAEQMKHIANGINSATK